VKKTPCACKTQRLECAETLEEPTTRSCKNNSNCSTNACARSAIVFDLAHLTQELEALEKDMASENFWGNPQRSKEVGRKAEYNRSILQEFRSLKSRLDDLHTLLELAEEDESLHGEADAEVATLEKGLNALELHAYLNGPYDANNCYLSLNAGAGGTEAQDWTDMLLRMYSRWLEANGYRFELLEVGAGEVAGIKSATLAIEHAYAYGHLKAEHGVHRLVRISPYDAKQRRHTSFASVNVVPQIEDEQVEIDEEDLRIDTYRSGGAGGQHVNKTDSAVRLTHLPTGIVVACQRERSQHQNKDIAMKLLQARLFELEQRKREQQLKGIQGDLKAIEWGSQIRSYVFQPYQLVKDHRTGVEVGNIQSVMDGKLDPFIEAYLSHQE